MKPVYWVLPVVLVLACSLPFVATQPPPTPTQAQVPTVAQPTSTLVSVPTSPPPTLQPIALAGPPMEVGSMWPYVDGSILVAVPGGPFTMGHGGSDNPEHTVTLSDFWIYQAKVTNQEYALCVKAGKCKAPDPIDDFTFSDVTHANDPVVGVTYAQASDYCTFVHGALPTEAQWEKTARGPNGNIYPWGSNAPVCDFLNFNNCTRGKITSVTAYPKGQSYYHALDTEGNVFEWVADWYSSLYYGSSPAQDPLGPDTGQQRSVRSSSYKSAVDQVPASTRFFTMPNDHRRDLGFRCVVLDPSYFAPMCQSIPSQPSAASPDCPKVGMGLTPVCQQGKVTVVVGDTRSPDPSATVTGLSSCSPVLVTPGSFPQIYDCTSDTTANITTTCGYKASSPATCADHYKLNTSTGMCVWDGSLTTGTQCLPGTAYDPSQQCCTATTSYAVCPLGSALGSVAGKTVCVPNGQVLNNPSDTEYIHIKDKSACTGSNPSPCPQGQYLACYSDPAKYPPTQVCYCVSP
jgi:sulfatase modifying factor 1